MTAQRTPPAWLVAVLVVMAFAFQGTRGLWEPDEGRYTSVGLNMLESGDWMLPTIDGEHPHLTKPPVTYWALAASFGLLGHNEWAARLPGALAFIGTGLLVFGLGRRLVPAKPWLPALVYATSLAPILGANVVSTDNLLAFGEALAMYCFVRAWADGAGLDRRWIRAMWMAWGLAFMIKGPPGLLPLAAIAAMLGFGDRKALRRLLDPMGLLLFAVIAFTWFAVLIAQDPQRLHYFLGYEVYDRVFTSTHDRNAQWYGAVVVYGPMFLLGSLPWWVLATIAAGGPRGAWSACRSRLRAGDRDWRLLAWWLLLPLLVFCLARSRLQLYVLPLFVPLSLMLARPLAGWGWLQGRRLVATAAIAGASLVALKGVAGHVESKRDARAMAQAIEQIIDPHSVDEIVFVGTRPFYGLNVYLDTKIEGVQIGEQRYAYSKFVAEEDLCSELHSRERSVYALKADKSDRFTTAVRKCAGLDAQPVGHFEADGDRIAVFAVRR